MIKGLFKGLFAKEPQCVCHAKSKSLGEAQSGRRLRVECLCGEESICQRLREMGFCESSVIEKVAESGSLICKVCDTKVILSKELADKIIVKDICPSKGHDLGKSPSQIIPLSQMSVGQRGVIDNFVVETDHYERIEEMGVTPGEVVEVMRYAPMGDPIEIKIRGYFLSLRKEEADRIRVKLL